MIAPSLGDARSRALVALLRFLHGPVIVTSSEYHVRLLLPAMKLMLAAGNTLHPLDQAQLRRSASKAKLDLVTIDVDEDRQGYPLLFDVRVRTKGRMQHLSGCSLCRSRCCLAATSPSMRLVYAPMGFGWSQHHHCPQSTILRVSD